MDMGDSYAYHMGEALRYSVTDIQSEHNLKETLQKYLNDKKVKLANDILLRNYFKS